MDPDTQALLLEIIENTRHLRQMFGDMDFEPYEQDVVRRYAIKSCL